MSTISIPTAASMPATIPVLLKNLNEGLASGNDYECLSYPRAFELTGVPVIAFDCVNVMDRPRGSKGGSSEVPEGMTMPDIETRSDWALVEPKLLKAVGRDERSDVNDDGSGVED